jgi:hypothetical protein
MEDIYTQNESSTIGLSEEEEKEEEYLDGR